MNNFLGHHHELRIPAMETLADLTKLIFHEKDTVVTTKNGDGGGTIHPAQSRHKSIHSQHKHKDSKGTIIETSGIVVSSNSQSKSMNMPNDFSMRQEQQRHNEIRIPQMILITRVNRIREIYLEERRKIDEGHLRITGKSELVQSPPIDIEDIFTEKRAIRTFVEKKANFYHMDIDENGERISVPRIKAPHVSTNEPFDGVNLRKKFFHNYELITEKHQHSSHNHQKCHISEHHLNHVPANRIHQNKPFDGNALRKNYLKNQSR